MKDWGMYFWFYAVGDEGKGKIVDVLRRLKYEIVARFQAGPKCAATYVKEILMGESMPSSDSIGDI